MIGWIKLHRKILDSNLWHSKEPFGVRDAWIDLLLLANHADRKILFDGEPYVVKRGQHVTSMRKLSERWGWGIKKTRKYLLTLEEEQMVHRESTNRHTLLTILNYSKYQGSDEIEGTPKDTQRDTQRDTQQDTLWDTQSATKQECKRINKNVKNEEEEWQAMVKRWVEKEEDNDQQ